MKSSIERPLSGLSTHTLVLVLTLIILWLSLVVAASLERTVQGDCAPGIQPLLVRVRRDRKNQRASLYADSHIVAWEDRGALLLAIGGLNRRSRVNHLCNSRAAG